MDTKTLKTMAQENIAQEAFMYLVSDANGIYMGQCFIERFDLAVSGISDLDRASLHMGPDSEYYDEAQDALCDSGILTDTTGKKWNICYQDGGIFAVDYDLINEWEELTGEEFSW